MCGAAKVLRLDEAFERGPVNQAPPPYFDRFKFALAAL